jgi:hypothetical protein
MSPTDEKELQRLAKMLEVADKQLPDRSPLREALMKAGIALSFAFIQGSRGRIEADYDFLMSSKKRTA